MLLNLFFQKLENFKKCKDWGKKTDTTSLHDYSTNIDLGAKNDKTKSLEL